jgi:hypothetical protein
MTGKNVATLGWNNRKAPGRAFPGAFIHNLWIPAEESLQYVRDHLIESSAQVSVLPPET